MKQIKITVNEDGSVEMEGQGFVGPQCEKFMKVYEEALGGAVKDRKKKPEYFRRETKTQKVGV